MSSYSICDISVRPDKQVKEDCTPPQYAVFCALFGITILVLLIALYSMYLLIKTRKFRNLSLMLFYFFILLSILCKNLSVLIFYSYAIILYGYILQLQCMYLHHFHGADSLCLCLHRFLLHNQLVRKRKNIIYFLNSA